jgi:phospholipase D3/4
MRLQNYICVLAIQVVVIGVASCFILRGLPDQCDIRLVESIPENLTYDAGSTVHMSTFDAWKTLIALSTKSINIASFYWTLNSHDVMNMSVPSAYEGETILKELYEKASMVNLKIANNGPRVKNVDLDLLAQQNLTEIRWVDFPRLGIPGILHTKMWVVDGRHAYLGSANMDFRSLTQVKELGLLFLNCDKLVNDLEVMFYVYWDLGDDNATVPSEWPNVFEAKSNLTNPISYDLQSNLFFASSPPQFSTRYRSQDIDALLHGISSAEKFVYLSVMSYAPLIVVYSKKSKDIFWPDIDNALRDAAVVRKVNIRLLISLWNHTSSDLIGFLSSLKELSKIPRVKLEVKLFVVPIYTEEQLEIPFGRVNHNKYMVTDKCAYIGTSNWSGDYFVRTGGISATITSTTNKGNKRNEKDLRAQTEELFLRDWNSKYAHPLPV